MLSEIGRTYIAGLLSPTSFIGLLLVIGVVMLWKGRVRLAKYSLTIAAICFVICSLAPLKYSLYSGLEEPYSLVPNDYKFVVVLGGKIYPHDHQPISSQITPSLLSRLSHAIALVKKNPDATLVLTGNGAELKTEAEVMEAFALEMGVEKNKIFVEKKSMNTQDHPLYLKSLLQGQKFVIVTSAYHMKRAMHLFRAQGLEGYASPTDFQNKHPLGASSLIMRGENLAALDRVVTEFYSTIFQKIKSLL
jgi:uncharacterized SAM-binding protein YcdF (DUF218 family)